MFRRAIVNTKPFFFGKQSAAVPVAVSDKHRPYYTAAPAAKRF